MDDDDLEDTSESKFKQRGKKKVLDQIRISRRKLLEPLRVAKALKPLIEVEGKKKDSEKDRETFLGFKERMGNQLL